MPTSEAEGPVDSSSEGGGWIRPNDVRLALLASVLGALLYLALCYPLLRGNIYQGSDLGAFHLPARSFYSYCLKHGYAFLWWPEQFCGYYLHGEGQAGMCHPLHLLLYRFLPLDWAFNLEFASAYAFLYAGMVALLRRWKLPWFAALFGANLFAFSGFTLLHFIHLQAIAVIAHLPWLLLSLDVLLHGKRGQSVQRAALSIALLLASQLLLGYPQYVLFTLMGMALYSAAHFWAHQFPKRIAWLAAGLALGLLLGAIQLLPTFDLVQSVQRQHTEDFWRSGSMPPLNLLQLAGPYFFKNRLAFGEAPWEYSLYTGMMPLLLSALLLLQRPRSRRWRTLACLFAAQAGLMLILALGEYGGLYGLLAQLPVLGSFRCSARHIVLIHFALAALAALAIASLPREQPTGIARRRMRMLTLGATVAGLLALAIALSVRRWGDEAMRQSLAGAWYWLAAGPALLVLGVFTVSRTNRWPVAGAAAIMLFATLDIGLYALPQVRGHMPQSTPLEGLLSVLRQELPNDPAFVPHGSEFRAHGNWRTARLAPLGLANYMGYVGLPPAWTLDPNADLTKQIAGVRWEKRPFSAREWTIHEDALPMARLVTETLASAHPREDIARIDVAATALTDEPVTLPPGTPGTVTWKRNSPGNVTLDVNCDTAQLLVFAQRYHPGWRATVGGAFAKVYRVNGDFMGCVVPSGTSEVHFRFAPRSFRSGAALSVAGLLLATAWAIALLRPKPPAITPGA